MSGPALATGPDNRWRRLNLGDYPLFMLRAPWSSSGQLVPLVAMLVALVSVLFSGQPAAAQRESDNLVEVTVFLQVIAYEVGESVQESTHRHQQS